MFRPLEDSLFLESSIISDKSERDPSTYSLKGVGGVHTTPAIRK